VPTTQKTHGVSIIKIGQLMLFRDTYFLFILKIVRNSQLYNWTKLQLPLVEDGGTVHNGGNCAETNDLFTNTFNPAWITFGKTSYETEENKRKERRGRKKERTSLSNTAYCLDRRQLAISFVKRPLPSTQRPLLISPYFC